MYLLSSVTGSLMLNYTLRNQNLYPQRLMVKLGQETCKHREPWQCAVDTQWEKQFVSWRRERLSWASQEEQQFALKAKEGCFKQREVGKSLEFWLVPGVCGWLGGRTWGWSQTVKSGCLIATETHPEQGIGQLKLQKGTVGCWQDCEVVYFLQFFWYLLAVFLLIQSVKDWWFNLPQSLDCDFSVK